MPTNFVKPQASIGAPANSATEYVNSTSSVATILPAAVGVANTALDLNADRLYKNAAAANDYSGKTKQEYEADLAQLKEQMHTAAAANDKATEQKYLSQYSDLVRAERQGAISATNAAVRQEALLKQYINRFPHLENSFRSVYSATRAVNEVNKFGEIKDPIEEGINTALEDSRKEGYTNLSDYFADKEKERLANKAQINAGLGMSIHSTLAERLATASKSLGDEMMQAVAYTTAGQGDFNGAQIAAALEQTKQRWINENFEKILADATAHSINPDAIISLDQRSELRKRASDTADAAIAYVKTLDTKDKFERALKIRQTLRQSQHEDIRDNLDKINPTITFLIDSNAQFSTAAFEKTWKVMQMASQNQLNIVDNLRRNAVNTGNTTEALQYDIGLSMLKAFSPDAAINLAGSIVSGATNELPNIGHTQADALLDQQAMQAAALFDQDGQAKIAAASLKKEQSTLGTVGIHWVTNPDYAKQLSNPAFQKEIDQTIKSSTVTAIGAIDQKEAEGIEFDSSTVSGPTEYKYGPFSSSKWDRQVLEQEVVAQGGRLPESIKAIDKLNTMYWIKRKEYGIDAADAWAAETLGILEQKANSPKSTGVK